MKISIITLFPEVFQPILNSSILSRAQRKGLVEFELVNLRDFGEGKHQVVDDRPYGGGVGMVLKPDVLTHALKSVIKPSSPSKKTKFKINNLKLKIILMSASGAPFKQSKAQEFSRLNHLIIICGHYEGVDQRFIEKCVDEEISIGDYVLTGGEIPAMVIVDSVTRLIHGVLEKPEAVENESFSTYLRSKEASLHTLLEGPQYTRPEDFEGEKVPEILLSGNHAQIEKWRKEKALEKTKKVRPDLIK